jgi:hypothetical protein
MNPKIEALNSNWKLISWNWLYRIVVGGSLRLCLTWTGFLAVQCHETHFSNALGRIVSCWRRKGISYNNNYKQTLHFCHLVSYLIERREGKCMCCEDNTHLMYWRFSTQNDSTTGFVSIWNEVCGIGFYACGARAVERTLCCCSMHAGWTDGWMYQHQESLAAINFIKLSSVLNHFNAEPGL